MKSRKELTLQVCVRYRNAGRREKSRILSEFTSAAGYNRSYAAMLLRNCGKTLTEGQKKYAADKRKRRGGGRKPVYTEKVREAVLAFWKLYNYQCGKRLVRVMRLSMKHIKSLIPDADDQTRVQLMKISPSTVDRMLKPERERMSIKRGNSYTRGTAALKNQIPVRTFGDWKKVLPGSLQADCVGHDGGLVDGQCSFTLVATDVHSGWTERRAMLNRASRWVIASLDSMTECMPFPVTEMHFDNGGEFINWSLFDYSKGRFRITRSRSGKKNDNCRVEQKNFDAVRKLVGYARYIGPEAVALMNKLYRVQGLLQNYFYASYKLVSKTRVGSRYRKNFDEPKTPAEMILACPSVDASVKEAIRNTLSKLNPITLARETERLQGKLIGLAKKVLAAPYGKRTAC